MKRLSLLAIPAVIGCARVVAPGGGPEDTEAPAYLECVPSPGVVAELPERIRLVFSERLEPYSSIPMLFPDPSHTIEFSGSSIEIRLLDAPAAATLTLLLPPGTADSRGNASPGPVNLAWTTVDTTATSTLAFQVSMQGGGLVPVGTMVRLQKPPDSTGFIRGAFPDTLGFGEIPWLEAGEYRVLAFDDMDGSNTWEDQTEPGVTGAFVLEPGIPLHLDLAMAVVDTVGPRMVNVSALDAFHVLVEWNEELSRDVPAAMLFSMRDVLGGTPAIVGTSMMPGRAAGKLILHTDRLPDTLLTLSASGIADLMGNPSRADSLDFWGTDTLPTEDFAVTYAFPADGITEVSPAGPYSISLSAWVPLDSIVPRYSITRVSDGEPVPGTMQRTDALTFTFLPDNHLIGQRQYRVDLLGGLATQWGDTLSQQSWVFSTAMSTLPGSITGRLAGTSREAILLLTPAGGEGEPLLEAFMPGEYTIQDVPGGRYTLAAFVDTNRNGSWDGGEPYGAWPGVLEVLPGQATTEVNIAILP